MRLFEVYQGLKLLEEVSTSDVERLRKELVNKLGELPNDETTMLALQEIEELLDSVHAGGRVKFVNDQLEKLNDPEVNQARKLIARLVMSLDATPEDRKKMLEEWGTDDGLIDINQLLTPGKLQPLSDVVRGYSDNPAIREIADELFDIEAYGKGKGELALGVMSSRVNLPDKGDLHVQGVGTVEVKTESVQGGRFGDQEVRPTSEYPRLAQALDQMIQTHLPNTGSSTGVNLKQITRAAEVISRTDDAEAFQEGLQNLLASIFSALGEDVIESLVDLIMKGEYLPVIRAYSRAAFDNYRAIKTEDVGVLFLLLQKEPFHCFFVKDGDDIESAGYRLAAQTPYPIIRKFDFRLPYPQTTIRPQ